MDLLQYVIIFVLIALAFPAGIIIFKINFLLVITRGKLWSSGNAQKRFIPTGTGLSLFYDIVIVLFTIDFSIVTDPVFQTYVRLIPIVIFPLFSGIFGVGIKHANNQLSKTDGILMALIRRTCRKGDSPEDNQIRDQTLRNVNSSLEPPWMEESRRDAFKLLITAFDSTLMVFIISLSTRRLRFCRFIDLDAEQQIEYIETWRNKPRLSYAFQPLLKLVIDCYNLEQVGYMEIWRNKPRLSYPFQQLLQLLMDCYNLILQINSNIRYGSNFLGRSYLN